MNKLIIFLVVLCWISTHVNGQKKPDNFSVQKSPEQRISGGSPSVSTRVNWIGQILKIDVQGYSFACACSILDSNG